MLTSPEYIAGLLDGEGCFSPHLSGRIQVSMADRRPVALLGEAFGGSVTGGHEDRRQDHYRDQHHWTLSKQEDVLTCLERVLPHLRVKYLEAKALQDQVLDAQSRHKEDDKRGALRERVKWMRTAHHIVSLDPGERTGWATLAMSENRLEIVEHGVLSVREMGFWLAETMPRYHACVIETWRPRPKGGSMNWIQGNQLLPVHVIGMARLCAWRSGTQIVNFGPDRKHVWERTLPDEFKARMKGSNEQHDQDALLHGWGYFWTNWVTDPTKLTIDEVR